MTTLMERSASTMTEISGIRHDVAQIQAAVQDTGIDIRISGDASGKPLDLMDIKDDYGLGEETPLLLEIK